MKRPLQKKLFPSILLIESHRFFYSTSVLTHLVVVVVVHFFHPSLLLDDKLQQLVKIYENSSRICSKSCYCFLFLCLLSVDKHSERDFVTPVLTWRQTYLDGFLGEEKNKRFLTKLLIFVAKKNFFFILCSFLFCSL